MSKAQDLTGQKFGRLTVIERAEDYVGPNGKHKTQWKCRCECGNILKVRADQIKNGHTKSCGCITKEKIKDLVGKKIGRWTVIKRVKNLKYNHSYWLCKCDCGNLKEVSHYNLIKGKSLSCGCIREEISKNINKKHGMTGTHIYTIWKAMKYRCKNENNKLYGGRGIKVCNEWLDEENGFINFYNWSIQNGYEENLSIDRIDVNGDYSPSNCRWATNLEQANNRRTNHYVTYNGKTQSVADWCRELNLEYELIKQRLDRGWNTQQVFEKEAHSNYKYIHYNNKTQHLSEWCRELNLRYNTIYARINDDWTPEEAFETPIGGKRND